MNEYDKSFAGAMMDVMEDWLVEAGISLSDDDVNIKGINYDILSSVIEKGLNGNPINENKMVNDLITALLTIIVTQGKLKLSEKLLKTFNKWKAIYNIWTNDENFIWEGVTNDLEEYKEAYGYTEDDEFDENDIWKIVDEEIERNYDDDLSGNLNIEVKHELVATGVIERWDKPRAAHLELNTRNIGEAIKKVISSFDGNNTFHVEIRDGEVVVSQTGHDNPVNPSIAIIRMVSDYDTFEELEEFRAEECININWESDTESIADKVKEVYGWE